MKPIKPEERRVANIRSAPYEEWINQDGSASGTHILQLDDKYEKGVGFHVYRMDPGTSSEPHEHAEDEQFLVLEGELIDNDGTVYSAGDLVWLKAGTQHVSHSPTGCLLAVHIGAAESSVPGDTPGRGQ